MIPPEGTAASPPHPDDNPAARLISLIAALAAELHRHAPRHIGLDTDLDHDLGMDSLARIELLSRVEKTFGVALHEQDFVEARTPRHLIQQLSRARGMPQEAARAVIAPGVRVGATAAPDSARTLIEVLEWHAAMHPERTHIRLYDDQAEGETISYRTLLNGARKMAAGLQALGLQPGAPVILMLQTGPDYFFCFYGALLAGGVPVPIYPPARASQLEDHIRRQQGILENCAASILITMREAATVARLLKSQVETLRHVITPQDLRAVSAENHVRVAVRADDLAFLQYTSGSTGQPKGVMLTHANLLANIRIMARRLGAGPQDVFVSWLPLYHDMGLIGAWLGSLYCAAELVVMSPLAFIARPERWLWAIHRHRATLSASPNFGYELCLRRLSDQDLDGLDLSAWRVAFNGAEPVSPDTLQRFLERFSSYGLRRGALMPVYGLAECALGLSFPPLDRGPVVDSVRRDSFLREGRATPAAPEDESALRFVSCGTALPEHEIRIVDATGRELPERQAGQLEFRGPSATRGYYRNPAATRLLVRGQWLDSGDLAYVAGGEVYLTGRVKDVIIHAGRNLYPHELEEAVGNIPGIRPGRVAAFGATDKTAGTERLVIVAETYELGATERERLRTEINAVVADLIAGPPDDVVFAPPGTILKTPSGKLRRAASRERYERGEIDQALPAVWRQILHLAVEGLPRRLRRNRRILVAALYGLYAHAVFWIVAPFAWLSVMVLPTPGLRWRAIRCAARLLAGLTGVRLRIVGREHLPPVGQTCIYIANHASYLDGALLAMALRTPVSFVAKAELRGNVLLRIFLQRIGTQFVERFDVGKGVQDVRELTSRVQDGNCLLFFPEGTFTRAPGLRPFRMGAFITAAAARVPLVPVALAGTRSLLRSGSWWPNPGRVVITFAPPIEPGAVAAADAWSTAVALRGEVRAVILRHCGEPDLVEERVAR